MRDQLRISLPVVRTSLTSLLIVLFQEDWPHLRYRRAGRDFWVETDEGILSLPTGQGALDIPAERLEAHARESQEAWANGYLVIEEHPHIETNVRILGGSPVVRRTRIDTAFLASLVKDEQYVIAEVEEIHGLYPSVPYEAVLDALEFEGLNQAA